MANEVKTTAGPAADHVTASMPRADSRSDAAETFSHLYKMSATAGVATTDYAAINSMAIVALILGVASVLALAWDVLLVIPLAGLVCALIAFRQIAGSNGTQAGKGLALAALLLALGFGGTALA